MTTTDDVRPRRKLGCVVSGKLGPVSTTDAVRAAAQVYCDEALVLAKSACVAAEIAVIETQYPDTLTCLGEFLEIVRKRLGQPTMNVEIAEQIDGLRAYCKPMVETMADALGWDLGSVKPGPVFATLALGRPAVAHLAMVWAACMASVMALHAAQTFATSTDEIGALAKIRECRDAAVRLTTVVTR